MRDRVPTLWLAAVFGLATPSPAQAQTAACTAAANAEDALRDLTKEAFLEAVQEAGIALGEKGVALAEAGRGTAGARLLEKGERAFFGAQLAGAVDDLILDPVQEYFESPSEEAASRAFAKLLEGAGKVVFPTAGIALDAGRFVIGTATWTVEEMHDAGRRQQIEATLFGRGADVALGSINNLLAQDPFFDSGPIRNRRLSRDNVGRDVVNEQDLRTLWFTHYRNFLIGGPMGLTRSSREEVDAALAEGWPHLKRYWAFKRAEVVVKELRSAFGARLRAAQKKATTEPCDTSSETRTPDPRPAPAPPPPPPPGPHLVLVDVTTEPADLTRLDKVWKQVNAPEGSTSGSASLEVWGSTSEYSWEVPAYLDATPRAARIKGDARSAKNAQGHFTRLAYSIGLSGDAKSDKPLPLGVQGLSDEGEKVEGEATAQVSVVRVTGGRVTLKVSVNYAFAVVYHYAESGPGKR